ncbi:MAG: polysaccharide deacetylase family protein [Candidatus Binatia bacterium]|nr:polysaccharide deacetylase family protein [Candidatus Binatia bacterium]
MIRNLAKLAIHHGGISSVARACLAGRAVILRYHSVSTAADGTHLCLDPGLAVRPEHFDRQCAYLARHYNVISLDEMVTRLIEGKPLPPKAVALTFDDGYLDNYTQAFPILEQHGLNATFYVTTNCIDNEEILWTGLLRFVVFTTEVPVLETHEPMAFRLPLGSPEERKEAFTKLVVTMKNVPTARRLELLEAVRVAGEIDDTSALSGIMMSWDQVREMHKAGMIFGAHTLTHPNLPNATPEEAQREIDGSGKALAEQINEPIRHFSYPNGRGSAHLTEAVKGMVRDAKFDSATTSVTGSVQIGDDPFALKRIGIYNRHGALPEFTLDIERGKIGA